METCEKLKSKEKIELNNLIWEVKTRFTAENTNTWWFQ